MSSPKSKSPPVVARPGPGRLNPPSPTAVPRITKTDIQSPTRRVATQVKSQPVAKPLSARSAGSARVAERKSPGPAVNPHSSNSHSSNSASNNASSPNASAQKKSPLRVTPSKPSKSVYAQPHSPIASASPRSSRQKKEQKEAPSYKLPPRKLHPEEPEDPDETPKYIFSPGFHGAHHHTHTQNSYPETTQQQQETAVVQRAPPQPPQVQVEEDNEDGLEEEEFDPFMFIKSLPPLSEIKNRRVCLPKKSPGAPRITLALDLDETLVHCSVSPLEKAELTFKVNFNGVDYEVYVRTRPHMHEFLRTVSEWFEVVIFTASQRVYADKLLDILDPKHQYIEHRVFRDNCVCVEGNYLKDLTVLGRELPEVAIVDNSVQAFGFQLDNGIPIESWFDDENDRELLNLLPFLRSLRDSPDVRPLIRQTFRLSEFVANL